MTQPQDAPTPDKTPKPKAKRKRKTTGRPSHRPRCLDLWQRLWDCFQEASSYRPPHQPEGTFTFEQARLAITRGLIKSDPRGESYTLSRLRTKLHKGRDHGYWVFVRYGVNRFANPPTPPKPAPQDSPQ